MRYHKNSMRMRYGTAPMLIALPLSIAHAAGQVGQSSNHAPNASAQVLRQVDWSQFAHVSGSRATVGANAQNSNSQPAWISTPIVRVKPAPTAPELNTGSQSASPPSPAPASQVVVLSPTAEVKAASKPATIPPGEEGNERKRQNVEPTSRVAKVAVAPPSPQPSTINAWTEKERPVVVASPVRELPKAGMFVTAAGVPARTDPTLARSSKYISQNTPPPPGAGLLGFLEGVVDKALAASPVVREVAARQRAAQFDIDQAKGQRWPQLQVGLSSPSVTFGSGANESARKAVGSVQVATPVYDWGRISSTIDSRSETALAAEEELEQTKHTVAYDTTSTVLELDRARTELVVSEAYLKRIGGLVEMLSEIVKSDPGRASELTQARARRLQAITARDRIRTRIRERQVDLAKLVGEQVTLPPTLDWDIPSLPLTTALAAAPEHPALRQSRAEARAATKYAESVRASRLPQVNWVVSKSTQEDSFGNTQPWATGLALQWTAFQGGSQRASEAAAYARASSSEEKTQTATRDLEYRLRTSAEQRDSARERATDYDGLIQESDRVRMNFYEQWHHLGKRTLLDVLIAENEHFENQLARVNSLFDSRAADLRMRADSAMLLRWLRPTAEATKLALE